MLDQDPSTVDAPAQSGHEISDYVDGLKQMELEGYEAGVKKARNALFVTAALLFIGEMVSVSIANLEITPILIGIALVESGIFVALAFWTRKKPYTAILTGLILFVALWIIATISAGFRGAIGGIIVRIVIITYLVRALQPAKAWQDAKKNM